MKCKECSFFKKLQKSDDGGVCKQAYNTKDLPFLNVKSDEKCLFKRTKLRCKNCKYWVEAKGTKREENIGGCTFGGGYFPTFLGEPCILKDKYLKQVEAQE